MRHRALFHNNVGIRLAGELCPNWVRTPREVLEHHVKEDMGRVPLLSEYLEHLPIRPLGPLIKRERLSLTDYCTHSVRKFGGMPGDYYQIHDFMEMGRFHNLDFNDNRYYLLLHHGLGPFLAEKRFGHIFTNSHGKIVSVRDVAEAHVIKATGRIPTVGDYLQHLPMLNWLGGPKRKPGTRIPGTEPVETPVD